MRGQVSIFVILGIFLVVAIGIFFFIFNSKGFDFVTPGREFDPETYLSGCVRDSLRDKLDIITLQGGFLNPADFRIYNSTKTTYVCKNNNYYAPCISQYPLYISSVEKEISSEISGDVESCLFDLENELKSRGFEYSAEESEIVISLKPEIVEINIKNNMQITQGQEVRNIDSFDFLLSHPIYDLAYVAQEIITQEAEFCHFENAGYSILYNNFDIRRDILSDSTKIYKIKHIPSDRTMNIAIRGCAIPAGF